MSTAGPVFDFPTAWKVMEATAPEYHHENCSYRVADRVLLCDCAALQSATAAWRAAHDDAEISDPCCDHAAEVDRLATLERRLTAKLEHTVAELDELQAAVAEVTRNHHGDMSDIESLDDLDRRFNQTLEEWDAARTENDRLRSELKRVTQELGDQEARDRHLQADALDWAAQQLHRYGAHHEEVGTVREWAGEVRAGTRTIPGAAP